MTGSTSPVSGCSGAGGCTGLGTGAAGACVLDVPPPPKIAATELAGGPAGGPDNIRFKMPVVVFSSIFAFTFFAIWSKTIWALAFKRPASVLHEFLRLSTNVMSFTLP